MTTVVLSGEMGRLFGRRRELALDSNSPAEALRALFALVPKLQEYLLRSKDRGLGFAVFRGRENIGKEQLDQPVGRDEIRFVPILTGSKNGGVLQVILGVVLVIVGAIGMSPWGQAFGGAVWGPYAMSAGIAMIAGGVVQLLSPHPRKLGAQDAPDNTPSDSFNGPVNTQAQGNCVGLAYGDVIVGSAVMSGGIVAQDVIVSRGPASAGVGGMGGVKFINVREDA